jgi:hypothetical protein
VLRVSEPKSAAWIEVQIGSSLKLGLKGFFVPGRNVNSLQETEIFAIFQ